MLSDYSGPRLKALRKRARLTQMQVVQLAGVSENTISYLEAGKRKPQEKTLDRILGVYLIRIQQINNMEKVFAEGETNAGNFTGQRTVGTGGAGLNAPRGPAEIGNARAVRSQHELSRLSRPSQG